MANERSIFDGLTLLDTYAYYDRPVLFTARSGVMSGVLLIVLMDEGKNYEYEKWLSVRMSEERYGELQRGEIDFHAAFRRAESGACVEITNYHKTDGIGDTFAPLLVEFLTNDELPLRGERVRKP